MNIIETYRNNYSTDRAKLQNKLQTTTHNYETTRKATNNYKQNTTQYVRENLQALQKQLHILNNTNYNSTTTNYPTH